MKQENLIQQQIVNFFTNNYCLKHHNPRCVIFHVANGGSRNVLEAINLKRMGVLSGVSDLIVLTPLKMLFIEVKNDIGKQSPAQIEFQARVESLGFQYFIVRSLADFKKIV